MSPNFYFFFCEGIHVQGLMVATGVLVFLFCLLQSSLVVPDVFIAGLFCQCLLLPIPSLLSPVAHFQPPRWDAKKQSPAWALPHVSPVDIGKLGNSIEANVFY